MVRLCSCVRDAPSGCLLQVALDIGFSLDTGRLDVSVHPFTGGGHPTDVRMTTRFKKDDVTEGLTGGWWGGWWG